MSDECGQSLVIALVLTGALSISVAGTVNYMTSNEGSFGRDRQDERALNIAEAGLNNGLALVAQKDADNDVGSLSASPASFDGGDLDYTFAKSGSTWTITATGTFGKVTRTVKQQVQYAASTAKVDASAVYGDGLFINGSSGCTSLTGNMKLNANIWVNNDLCITGNTNLTPSQANKYTLYVGGKYSAVGNINTGSASYPLASADIVSNKCNVVGGGSAGNVDCTKSSASHIYAGSYLASVSTAQVKPTIDAAAVYASGKWNTPNCTTGSFTFDSDSTMNGTTSVSRPGDVTSKNNPFGGSSYACTVPKASGSGTIGSLAWNSATKTLTISGTIFIDGSINLVGNYNVDYTGNGTIYVDGVISNTGNVYVCGPGSSGSGVGSCQGTIWNPASGQLGVVAINPKGASSGYQFTGNGQWDVTALAVGAVVNTGNVVITGPVIADSGSFTGNMGMIIPTSAPQGAPTTATTTVYGWGVVPGSWRQTQ